jgi:hypothetical protein
MLENMDYHMFFLSHLNKEGLYLLTPFQHQNFHIDQCVVEGMNILKTFANWTTFFPQFKTFIIHMLLYKLLTQIL